MCSQTQMLRRSKLECVLLLYIECVLLLYNVFLDADVASVETAAVTPAPESQETPAAPAPLDTVTVSGDSMGGQGQAVIQVVTLTIECVFVLQNVFSCDGVQWYRYHALTIECVLLL